MNKREKVMDRKTIRHALFVYPYQQELSALGVTATYPPLGLEIIAAVMEPYCIDMDIIDFRRDQGQISDYLKDETDLVCISINWSLEEPFIISLIRSLPDQIRTIVGGRYATEDPEKWLRQCPNIDILIRGDGEDILEKVMNNESLSEIKGISYRSYNRVTHNATYVNHTLREDLFPNRTRRRYTWSTGLERYQVYKTFDTIVTSRGCPFNCLFCSFSRNPWGVKRPWTPRSAESVVQEIEQTDAEFIAFVDDIFTHDMDRIDRICDLILKRGIKKHYSVSTRLEIARRPDVLAKMKKAGFIFLLLGIESAQDKTLKSMKKGFDTQKAAKYMKIIRRSGMILHGFFLVGALGETEEEMLEIAPFARKLGIDNIQTCILRNSPHSGLEELVYSYPGYHIAPDGTVYCDECSVKDLEGICNRIHKEFYTPGTITRLIWKAVHSKLITINSLLKIPGILIRKPWIQENNQGHFDGSGTVQTYMSNKN